MTKEKLIELMNGKVIKVQTILEAHKVLKYLYSLGFEWFSLTKGPKWNFFKENTVYFVEHHITFGELGFHEGFEPLTYKQFKNLIKGEK